MIHADLSLDAQVTLLRAYRILYYHTGEWLITDKDFDELDDHIRALLPSDHPFLAEVGAPPLNKIPDDVWACVNWLAPNAFKPTPEKAHKNFHLECKSFPLGSDSAKKYRVQVWCWYDEEEIEGEEAAKIRCAELFKRLKNVVKTVEDVK